MPEMLRRGRRPLTANRPPCRGRRLAKEKRKRKEEENKEKKKIRGRKIVSQKCFRNKNSVPNLFTGTKIDLEQKRKQTRFYSFFVPRNKKIEIVFMNRRKEHKQAGP